MNNPHTQANRTAWDAVVPAHVQHYHIDKLLAGEPLLNEIIRSEVGDVTGKSLIHLLCHIGTDTLSWALLGAQVAGVDISPEAITAARELAQKKGIMADFTVSDVMELEGKINKTYDIVFSSTGVLCWLPDIHRYFNTARRLLKPGGFFYIFDGHPFRNMYENGEIGKTPVVNDYFFRGPYEYDNFTDYTTPLVIPAHSYEWTWTVGDIINAVCQAGLRIEFLHEYPQYFYGGYTPTEGESQIPQRYPCTFSLKAVAA